MDEFKQAMTKRCGPGGIKCHCCNKFHHAGRLKDKNKLDRLARRMLKNELQKMVDIID